MTGSILGQIWREHTPLLFMLLLAACDPGAERGQPAHSGADRIVHRLTDVRLGLPQRQKALDALIRLGPAAVPPLQQALRHPDGVVRYHAAEALSAIGASGGKLVLAALESALSDRQFVVRETAAEGLARLGPAAIPVLGRALADDDDDVRAIAAKALARLAREALPTVVQVLVRKNRSGRLGALAALSRLRGHPRAVVKPVADALADPHPPVRVAAAKMLGRLRAGAPELTRALDDSRPEVQVAAAEALGELGPNRVGAAVPALVRQLGHRDANVRKASAAALGRLASSARGAVPELLSLLDDPEADVRVEAATALGLVGASEPEILVQGGGRAEQKIVTGLVKMFETDRLHHSSHAAAGALGELRARAAVPVLIRAVRDPLRRHPAASALGAIGDPRALPALAWALRHHLIGVGQDGIVSDVADPVGQALGAMGGQAVPTLRTLLRDRDEEVRDRAARALTTIGTKASAAVPDLMRVLRGDRSAWVRCMAARALGAIGDARAIPALRNAARGDSNVALHLAALLDRVQVVDRWSGGGGREPTSSGSRRSGRPALGGHVRTHHTVQQVACHSLLRHRAAVLSPSDPDADLPGLPRLGVFPLGREHRHAVQQRHGLAGVVERVGGVCRVGGRLAHLDPQRLAAQPDLDLLQRHDPTVGRVAGIGHEGAVGQRRGRGGDNETRNQSVSRQYHHATPVRDLCWSVRFRS